MFKLRLVKGKTSSCMPVRSKGPAALFSNVQKYLEDNAKDDAYNIFASIAHYKDSTRRAEMFDYQEIIPFDIDHVDLSKIDQYPKAIAKGLGIDAEKCVAICSGNGVHFAFWPDKFRITKVDDFKLLLPYYAAWCVEVKNALTEAGLTGDVDEQFFQPARSLRVPFTRNCKPAGSTPENCVKNVPVYFIEDETFIYDDLQSQFFLFTEIKPIKDDKEKEYLKKGSYGKPDIPYILDNCLFLKEAIVNSDTISEPTWFEAVNIVAHFQDDYKTAHDISKGYSGYSSEETQERAERANYSYGPSLCGSVEKKVFSRCKECPHYGKIRSPIQLKSKEHISTGENGFTVMVKGKPQRQYEDLRRFFNEKNPYVTLSDNRSTWIFDGKKYIKYDENNLRDFAQKSFSPICEKDSERLEFCKQVTSFNMVERGSFEPPPGMINLMNGLLDVKTRRLIPHSPSYYFTYVLPYSFDPLAECPTWEEFLKNISCGRQAIMDCLEEFIGYCLLGGEYYINKILILAGDGSNGKTTLINVMRKILALIIVLL